MCLRHTEGDTLRDKYRKRDRSKHTLKQPGEFALAVWYVVSLRAFTKRTNNVTERQQTAVYVDT